nr:hypothetical protein [Angustibacter aerolatus]
MQAPALLTAYRTGGGVPWSAYGEGMRTGQADLNRPWYLGPLGTEWLPALPEARRGAAGRGTGRRRRVRRGVVEHRDRPRLPGVGRRRLRPRRALGGGGVGARAGRGAERPADLRRARRRHAARRVVRRGEGLRVRARPGRPGAVPGRGAPAGAARRVRARDGRAGAGAAGRGQRRRACSSSG